MPKQLLRDKLPMVALVVTSLFFVANNSMVRILDRSFTPTAQVFWRTLLAGIFVYIFFGSKIRWRHLATAPRRDQLLLVVLGILGGGIATVFRTYGFLNTTLINVQFIDLLAPAIVYVYSLFLLKQKFDWRFMAATIFSVYGVLIVATDRLLPLLSNYGRGELFATAAVLTTSLTFIVRKVLTANFTTAEISWTSFAVSATFLLPFTLALGDPLISNFDTWVLVTLLANALLTASGIMLLNYALKHVSPTLGSQVNQMKIIFTLIIGFVFFGELPTILGLVGGMIVVSAIYLISIMEKRRPTI